MATGRESSTSNDVRDDSGREPPAVAATDALARAAARTTWIALAACAGGGLAALVAAWLDGPTALRIGAGALVSGSIVLLAAVRAVLVPARRADRHRAWLISTLNELAKVNREMEFRVLVDEVPDRELEDVASACYAALLSAHRDRLEAAALRREMNSRVEKRTRVAVAQLSRISNTDELTGLLNRRGFDQAFTLLWNEAARGGDELALVAIDLDCFKELNDRCGHDKGDEALRVAGSVLRERLREGDIAGRIGGDEMIVCLRGARPSAARAVAERFMTSFAMHPESQGLPWPTMSVGIACAGTHEATTPDQLRRMADEALYGAKRGGRAVCVVYGETSPSSGASVGSAPSAA